MLVVLNSFKKNLPESEYFSVQRAKWLFQFIAFFIYCNQSALCDPSSSSINLIGSVIVLLNVVVIIHVYVAASSTYRDPWPS